MSNKPMTKDEEMAMIVVTFCSIGDVQTHFHCDRDGDGKLSKAYSTLEFRAPGASCYHPPHTFLKNKQVKNKLKTGLFKAYGKEYVKAHSTVLKYLEEQGY